MISMSEDYSEYDYLANRLGLSEGGVNKLNKSGTTVLSMNLIEETKEDMIRKLGGDGCNFLFSVRGGQDGF